MPTQWEVARLAQVAGIETTFTFYPDRLTPRVRNAAKKIIRTRVLTGGYRSQARNVAKLMMARHNVPHVNANNRWVEVGNVPREVRDSLLELRQADWAAYKLSDGHIHPYYIKRYESDVEMLKSDDEVGVIHFDDLSLGKKAVSFLQNWCRSEQHAGHAEAVASILDTDQPIVLPITYSRFV